MRNISQLGASLVLLATQANMTFNGSAAAAQVQSQATSGVYEVSLNTKTSSAIEIVGPKQPNYDAEVLAPLRAAQAATAEKARQAALAAAAAAKAKARAAIRVSAPAAAIPGSHADWMRAAGIADSDFGYVDYIINHESGWGVTKWNYSGSGAYGIGQALPASKMAPFGADYMTNPVTQLRWANAYAVGRFGSWANAYSHWLSYHSW